jgi:hypothetical protein
MMVTSPTTQAIATTAEASPKTALYRIASALFLAQFAIFMVTLVVLGNAINWPASLGEPASVTLPLITEQRAAVTLGYFSYMVSAFLLMPISVLLYRIFSRRAPTLIGVGATMGIVAGIMKILGIARWLVLMPAIAAIYLDPAASAATRDAAAVAFEAFNNYAGGVGEMLGVTLFSSLWTGCVAIAILRTGILPRWTGWFGLIAAAAVIMPFAEVFAIETGTVVIVGTGVIWQLWMIAMGGVLLRNRPQEHTA